MINYIQFLNMPSKVALSIVAAFLIIQIIGELLEFKGKVVPEFIKIRKYFIRKKTEKEEAVLTQKELKTLLNDVNSHYSADNIAKRDSWMNWVNNRAEIYDASIAQISNDLAAVAQALKDNTRITEEVFVQSSRDRIIDFATKVSDDNVLVSREEFKRIFKVHKDYESFLEERNKTNGEIDINFRIVEEAYEHRVKNHSFIEDIRGYDE